MVEGARSRRKPAYISNFELKTNPEYERLLPKIPAKECEALKESTKTEGIYKIIEQIHPKQETCLELLARPKEKSSASPRPIHNKKSLTKVCKQAESPHAQNLTGR